MNTHILKSFLRGYSVHYIDDMLEKKYGSGRINDNCGFSIGLSIEYTLTMDNIEEDSELCE